MGNWRLLFQFEFAGASCSCQSKLVHVLGFAGAGLMLLPAAGSQSKTKCHVPADRLGYRYVWQTDDDSRLLKSVAFNLRAFMQTRGLLMAARRKNHDPVSVTAGAGFAMLNLSEICRNDCARSSSGIAC